MDSTGDAEAPPPPPSPPPSSAASETGAPPPANGLQQQPDVNELHQSWTTLTSELAETFGCAAYDVFNCGTRALGVLNGWGSLWQLLVSLLMWRWLWAVWRWVLKYGNKTVELWDELSKVYAQLVDAGEQPRIQPMGLVTGFVYGFVKNLYL